MIKSPSFHYPSRTSKFMHFNSLTNARHPRVDFIGSRSDQLFSPVIFISSSRPTKNDSAPKQSTIPCLVVFLLSAPKIKANLRYNLMFQMSRTVGNYSILFSKRMQERNLSDVRRSTVGAVRRSPQGRNHMASALQAQQSREI
jgi:hypothetical protein